MWTSDVIQLARGELRGAETRVDVGHTHVTPDDGEAYAPFLDCKLQPIPGTADAAIGVGSRAECERGLDTLANCEAGVGLDPLGLLGRLRVKAHYKGVYRVVRSHARTDPW